MFGVKRVDARERIGKKKVGNKRGRIGEWRSLRKEEGFQQFPPRPK